MIKIEKKPAGQALICQRRAICGSEDKHLVSDNQSRTIACLGYADVGCRRHEIKDRKINFVGARIKAQNFVSFLIGSQHKDIFAGSSRHRSCAVFVHDYLMSRRKIDSKLPKALVPCGQGEKL